MQKKFKTLQSLDGQELPKLITFEDDDEGTSRPKTVNLPNHIKMVVNDQVGDFIGKFLEQYFKVYDSDNREQLSMAYHEEAMMSMSASFQRNAQDESTQSYKEESRNLRLDFIRENVNRRDRHLHQKRLQIVGFLDKLPKTQHDLTSFTLDVPFATERLVTFTVSGAFRERLAAAAGAASTIPAVRHFNRMFVVVPQGEGLCIINDSLFVTGATREQSERTNTLFTLSQQTGMNLHWSNICLTDQGWDLTKARSAYETAKQDGKIPPEAFS